MKRQGEFNRILKDIKSIKIQGAENVARAGIKAYLLSPTKASAKKILAVRPTEPLLQNALKLLEKSKDKEKMAKEFLKELKASHKAIVDAGSKLIKNNTNVFTHCHSSTVVDILKQAKKEGKKFRVFTTEVEPLLQGRMTAKDLAKIGVEVTVAPDLAADYLMKEADILLFGVDAFSSGFLANKIGTDLLCRLARHHHVPRFACGVSLKYTKKIQFEKRSGKEVWDENYKKIEVIYPAFDRVKYSLLTGIISEFGATRPKDFVKKAKIKLKKFS